ncbi:MAG: BLUF domain-containing protein [Granulosicoccus sp.]
MNNNLYRMVYLSRNNISTDEAIVRTEITQILRSAREKNVKDDITGALMFNAACFAQVLEGPHDKVKETFDRIECDDRHSDIVVLDFNQIDNRGFPNWSMAYVGEDSTSVDRFFMIAEETNFQTSHLSGDQVFEALLAGLEEADTASTSRNAA